MQTIHIQKHAGILELVPAEETDLREIARYWPMDLIRMKESTDLFGLVFQHGERQMRGVRMQFGEIPESKAQTFHYLLRVLIALGLPLYARVGHPGVMAPCAYLRPRDGGNVDVGVGFFVGPDAASRTESEDPSDVPFDTVLGAGATTMVQDMITGLQHAIAQSELLPQLPEYTLEVTSRVAMGQVALQVLARGSKVYVVQQHVQEREVLWEYLIHAGFTSFPYAPMAQLILPESPAEDLQRL